MDFDWEQYQELMRVPEGTNDWLQTYWNPDPTQAVWPSALTQSGERASASPKKGNVLHLIHSSLKALGTYENATVV